MQKQLGRKLNFDRALFAHKIVIHSTVVPHSWANPSHAILQYTNSLVNADSFYANFTNTTFQKIPIPHLTRTMKRKFLH